MFCLKYFAVFAALVFTRSSYCDIQFTSAKSLFPNDKSFINFDNLKLQQFNQSGFLLNGSFELFVDLGDDYEVETLLNRISDGSFQMIFQVGPEKFCSYMKSKEESEYGGACDIPAKTVCPWPKRKYICNGFHSTATTYPGFPAGDYMLEVRYWTNGKVLNGYQNYFTIKQ